MSISSNKIVRKPEILVDHNFAIPPTVVDVRHESDDDLIGQVDEFETPPSEEDQPSDAGFVILPIAEFLEDNTVPVIPSTGGAALPVPTFMAVVEQIYSVADDGTALVDVIIETPDMRGVTQIDVRVARA